MLRLRLIAAVLLVACNNQEAPVAPLVPPPEKPGLFIVNARIFGAPEADALLSRGDTIAAVGKRGALETQAIDARIIDAQGATVLPGFHDSHIHMMGGGMEMVQVQLEKATTMEAALAAVKQFAESHPDAVWIHGRGWQYRIVAKGKFPTRQDLDRVVPDRPVFLRSYDGHSGWANSRALAMANIDKTTKDPADGKVVREADKKTPAGALLDGGMDLVWKVLPELPRPMKLEALERATKECVEMGLTTVDDIVADPTTIELYAELEKTGRLPLRVTVSMPIEGDFAAYEKLREQYHSPYVRTGFIKGFVDGVIESKTAFMLKPYTGSTETGKPFIPADKLLAYINDAHKHGFAVALHAIGDAAVRESLDAFEKAEGRGKFRDRIEHIEAFDPTDVARFATIPVIASMMPFHSNPFGDTPDSGVWSENLGAERLKHTFPWRELVAARAPLAFGSDWPVMTQDPLQGLAVAVTRQDEKGRPKAGWNKQQALTMDEAVRAYTEGSAYAVGLENEMGRLVPGQLADFVVLKPTVDLTKPETLWTGDRLRAVVVGGVVRAEK